MRPFDIPRINSRGAIVFVCSIQHTKKKIRPYQTMLVFLEILIVFIERVIERIRKFKVSLILNEHRE